MLGICRESTVNLAEGARVFLQLGVGVSLEKQKRYGRWRTSIVDIFRCIMDTAEYQARPDVRTLASSFGSLHPT